MATDRFGLFVDETGAFIQMCAQRAETAAVAAGSAVAAGVGMMFFPSSTSQCDVVTPKPEANCPEEDDCAKLYAQIDAAVKDLKKRYWEYAEDRLRLPQTGPFSRRTHREQFENRQKHLRRLFDEANTKAVSPSIRRLGLGRPASC